MIEVGPEQDTSPAAVEWALKEARRADALRDKNRILHAEVGRLEQTVRNLDYELRSMRSELREAKIELAAAARIIF